MTARLMEWNHLLVMVGRRFDLTDPNMFDVKVNIRAIVYDICFCVLI